MASQVVFLGRGMQLLSRRQVVGRVASGWWQPHTRQHMTIPAAGASERIVVMGADSLFRAGAVRFSASMRCHRSRGVMIPAEAASRHANSNAWANNRGRDTQQTNTQQDTRTRPGGLLNRMIRMDGIRQTILSILLILSHQQASSRQPGDASRQHAAQGGHSLDVQRSRSVGARGTPPAGVERRGWRRKRTSGSWPGGGDGSA